MRRSRAFAAFLVLVALLGACDNYARERPPKKPVTYGKGKAKGLLRYTRPLPKPSKTLDHPKIEIRLAKDSYAPGDVVEVAIRNDGDEAFAFWTRSPACNIAFTDPAGKRFVPPDGIACDDSRTTPIPPGETTVVYRWHLDRCGSRIGRECGNERTVEPGVYQLVGQFPSLERKGFATPRATVRVTAA